MSVSLKSVGQQTIVITGAALVARTGMTEE